MKQTGSKYKNKKKRNLIPESPVQALSLKRFLLTYIVLMGVFFTLIALQPIRNIVDLNGLYTKGIVAVTSSIMKVLGLSCTHQGGMITLPGVSLNVRFGCNGLEAVMIYAVAVIAFPTTWKKRAVGILAGFALIQTVNVLRIIALAYSALHFKRFFEYIHIYIAQGMMIAVALGTYLLWTKYAKDKAPQT